MWKSGVFICLKITVCCIVQVQYVSARYPTTSLVLGTRHESGRKHTPHLSVHSIARFPLSTFCSIHSTSSFGILSFFLFFKSLSERSASLHEQDVLSHLTADLVFACVKFSHVVSWFQDRLNWYTGGCETLDFSAACFLHTLHGSWERKLNEQKRGQLKKNLKW